MRRGRAQFRCRIVPALLRYRSAGRGRVRHGASHRLVRDFNARRQARVAAAVYRALASTPGRPAADAASALGTGWQMLLAESRRRLQAAALARWRGRMDALALRTRYSDRRRHKACEPLAAPAQMLFSLLEQNRVEQLGARRLAGVHANLCALTLEKWIRAPVSAGHRCAVRPGGGAGRRAGTRGRGAG